eukprot:TRINITY_DN45980_c0_g1_i4.p1 TRINITY_DN45980_c0_g1~~TRINITY_DN45980_c0_g1_i4.p1  ORF type:complete len:663 (+),score=143.65 TRINITY_DN45980_c0_g1_i4:585-2573(+)
MSHPNGIHTLMFLSGELLVRFLRLPSHLVSTVSTSSWISDPSKWSSELDGVDAVDDTRGLIKHSRRDNTLCPFKQSLIFGFQPIESAFETLSEDKRSEKCGWEVMAQNGLIVMEKMRRRVKRGDASAAVLYGICPISEIPREALTLLLRRHLNRKLARLSLIVFTSLSSTSGSFPRDATSLVQSFWSGMEHLKSDESFRMSVFGSAFKSSSPSPILIHVSVIVIRIPTKAEVDFALKTPYDGLKTLLQDEQNAMHVESGVLSVGKWKLVHPQTSVKDYQTEDICRGVIDICTWNMNLHVTRIDNVPFRECPSPGIPLWVEHDFGVPKVLEWSVRSRFSRFLFITHVLHKTFGLGAPSDDSIIHAGFMKYGREMSHGTQSLIDFLEKDRGIAYLTHQSSQMPSRRVSYMLYHPIDAQQNFVLVRLGLRSISKVSRQSRKVCAERGPISKDTREEGEDGMDGMDESEKILEFQQLWMERIWGLNTTHLLRDLNGKRQRYVCDSAVGVIVGLLQSIWESVHELVNGIDPDANGNSLCTLLVELYAFLRDKLSEKVGKDEKENVMKGEFKVAWECIMQFIWGVRNSHICLGAIAICTRTLMVECQRGFKRDVVADDVMRIYSTAMAHKDETAKMLLGRTDSSMFIPTGFGDLEVVPVRSLLHQLRK